MKNKIQLILIGIFFSFSFAQSQEIPIFKSKMYVDSLNHLYINKNTGIYLWLSISNNKDSAVLLQSKVSKNYVNPFYLDTEGKNTVRSPSEVNKITKKAVLPKKDIIFEVYADGLAPITKIHFKSAKKYYKNQKLYFGKGLIIKLEANDSYSGVADIYYSINGSRYQIYNKKLEFPVQNEFTIKYFAIDHVGNVEKIKTKTFFIDLTGPVIKKELKGNTISNILSKNAHIVLSAYDSLSGLYSIYYSIDGKNPIRYSNPIPASLFKSGEHKLNYFSVDNVGNTSLIDDKNDIEFQESFIFDKTGPSVNFKPEGTCSYIKNNIAYLSKYCQINFDASDDYTAVKVIQYGLNITSNLKTFTEPFTLEKKNIIQTLYYRAVDEVNNYSVLHSQKVVLDDMPPVSWINFGTPQFFDRDTLFITKNTMINLKSKDNGSGVQKTEYSLNNDKFIEGTRFKIEKNGLCRIKFKSTDNVQNIETVKESYVVIDNSPPKIYARFSIEQIKTKEFKGEQLPVYPAYSKIYIAATDQNSGTSKILYSVNGSLFKDYIQQNQIAKGGLFTKPGYYEISIKAIDKLGNTGTKLLKFISSEI